MIRMRGVEDNRSSDEEMLVCLTTVEKRDA